MIDLAELLVVASEDEDAVVDDDAGFLPLLSYSVVLHY